MSFLTEHLCRASVDGNVDGRHVVDACVASFWLVTPSTGDRFISWSDVIDSMGTGGHTYLPFDNVSV